ncbi:hypothetical protein P7C70_g6953, partial [Phenoliferia sp. Uapishka_3]
MWTTAFTFGTALLPLLASGQTYTQPNPCSATWDIVSKSSVFKRYRGLRSASLDLLTADRAVLLSTADFSGHEDFLTTHGWSNEIARIYLNSLVTFDMGSHEVKNITSYATNAATSNTSTPESTPVYRADGTFTFVPGVGTDSKGILVAIGGATEDQYVDNSVLDVYDIGAAGWTKQATLGDTLGDCARLHRLSWLSAHCLIDLALVSRVNHCAVRASAKVHGVETHQIFIYGGQLLNQTGRVSDVYILSIPSYTWTFVGDDLSGQPTGRAGHQCALHGSQLLVVGGYLGADVICDQPGVYVYDVSKSAWQTSFTANTIYSTPALVANITGGIGTGSSSSGSGSASGGDGSADADTSGSTSSTSGGTGTLQGSGSHHSSNAGAIAGGVVGGVIGLLIILLVLLLYRRKKRREAAAVAEAEAREKELAGFPYDKRVGSGSGYGWRASGGSMSASDDVEDETRGMEAAFGSHLVPKQQLRVTNPENEDEEERGNRIESLMMPDGSGEGSPSPRSSDFHSSPASGTPTTPSP